MLSYRHAFHAANHADVLKHLTLIACLDYLGRKPVPYLYVDTHAGAGAYELDVGYAALNAEWAGGWQRLTAEVDAPLAVATPDLVKRYISLVDSFRQAVGDEAAYPGSPLLAASCLTPGSRAVFCELHPADHALLAERCQRDARLQIRREDGFSSLIALLPPPTRRGLVLIDPSYELAADYTRLVVALGDALKRFATGMYLVWYPILQRPEALGLPGHLAALATAAGRPWLDARLPVEATQPGARGMSGSGIFIVNPPYTLDAELRLLLPYLSARLSQADAGWSLKAGAEA
ncbi:MAG: hypothetical protein A2087_08275 [Spirochaetes bacterium GWD1_61_31]|nr:MAG: hypothetical protein A2Y37_13805 [Spirochaetes bacterium GWB1_60_80]OHD32674.1 MAG: hypothetical protein A2004_02360 [Spirochaetes bacterium GWC1_61_12]OHD42084.1 MAG: hypothetical protein A2Y35_07480 [Spirochaetes bacterium GWE1_60_18]OHD42460.1 MAG: hypothetical protein A2087_08275 [Spirochaetes bacterium GWD1_61_31]OHD60982.1 MAG: hypothetical protein A2Y32_03430 [Spirochaetes bacterium GWF1_60_12]HAP42788.1 23S rRNA (adenine(2030)-N(6))-methyltransferase RlmJ [Spirochaetaceae bacte